MSESTIPVLLLHGAIGAAAQFDGLKNKLTEKFDVLTMNFPGHGGTSMPEAFSIELFAEDVIKYLDANRINAVHIFGYSMGGYVALYLAVHHPARIRSVATLATKFEWDKTIAEKEIKMLNPAVIEQKLPKFAQLLEQRHAPVNWHLVLQKTSAMMLSLGEDNILHSVHLNKINCPVIVMLGDRDKMVSFEETINVYRQIPTASFSVIPNTPHPIEQVDDSMLAYNLEKFFPA